MNKPTISLLLPILASAVGVAACSGNDSEPAGQPPPGAMAPPGGGASDAGATAPVGIDPCQPYDFVYPARKGIPQPAAADSRNIYFSAGNVFQRVPVGGGEPMPMEIEPFRLRLWPYREGLLLFVQTAVEVKLGTVPPDGGSMVPILRLGGPDVMSAQYSHLGLEGEQVFGIATKRGTKLDLSDAILSIHQFDLATGKLTVLALGMLDRFSHLVRSGQTYFFSVDAVGAIGDRLYSVTADGTAPTQLLPDRHATPVVADEQFLYLVSAPRGEPLKQSLYRMPVAGGPLELLIEGPAIIVNDVASTPDGHFLNLVDSGSRQLWFQARAGGAPVKLACATLNKSGFHGLVAHGRTAYVSVLLEDGKQDVASIARVAAP